MYQIFQSETGGEIAVPFNPLIPAVSGFAILLGADRKQYRFDGRLQSGELLIAKSGIGQLPAGEYLMLAQVTDARDLIYFLTPQEVEVVYVPDFFQMPR